MSRSILHIRLDAPSYSSDAIEKGFRENGFEYHSLSWQNYRFSFGIEGLRSEIIRLQSEINPDYIFLHIQVPDIIDAATAKKLSEKSFVINFTEDVREDTTWYEEVGAVIGLTVFTNMDDVKKLNEKGITAAYTPTSFNDLIYKKQDKTEKHYGDIIFIANNYVGTNLNFPMAERRLEMVKFLKDNYAERFKVYGMNWGSVDPDARLLSPTECVEAYNNCKVSISQSNFIRKGYSSDRMFNSMASNAITLPEYYEGIEQDFNHLTFGLHWDNFDELKKAVDLFINNDMAADFFRGKLNHYVHNNCNWTKRINSIMYFVKKSEWIVPVHQLREQAKNSPKIKIP